MSLRCSALLLLSVATLTCASTPSPVVIVPGDGSNQLEAQLNKPSTPHFYCSKTASWYRLWLSLSQLVPGAVDCWADNMRLVVDPTTGRAQNAPGVSTRVPHWGSTEGFEEVRHGWLCVREEKERKRGDLQRITQRQHVQTCCRLVIGSCPLSLVVHTLSPVHVCAPPLDPFR